VAGFTRRSGVRQAVLTLAPAALAARLLPAQTQDSFPVPGVQDPPPRLPNGKLQRDEILKAEYDQNLKDARDLVERSKAFELDLEKSDRFVLSIGLLKKLDDIERIAKRIRGRMKK
jgi:hypothetical protein